MAQQTAANAGIRWWISDTSRTGQNNPTFNTGFTAPGDSRLYIVPRHPTNQFYDVSTPAEWTSLYNYFYGPGGALCAITTCYSANQTPLRSTLKFGPEPSALAPVSHLMRLAKVEFH